MSSSTTPSTGADGAARDPQTPKQRLISNIVSYLGFFLIAVSLLLILTFALFVMVTPRSNPYVDFIGFLILPGVFVMGLALVPIGMLWRLWSRRHQAAHRRSIVDLPRLDLNDLRTRTWALAFACFTVFVVLPVLAVSSYTGYHYTESTAFCGQTCHSVMEPEAVAHALSPHARVTCAECHIGAGAGWFVKSKISGTRQIFATWLDTYRRPIPPAITELRPARDTCEECHWPEKFYGFRYQESVHYSPDEDNTRRVVRMMLKVGGADPTVGRTEGIHKHMALEGRTEYVALDEELQEIPWVKYVQDDGAVRIFRSDGKPYDAPPPDGVRRTLDCMDCHNRGAHHFLSPQAAVDKALDAGEIDATLPFIKRESVRAILGDYRDKAAAEAGIEKHFIAFYQQEYPDVWQTRQDAVRQAAKAVAEHYKRSIFPAMKVNWRTYPENVGHMISPGCFRCHDGLHVDDTGDAIMSTCETCHVFMTPRDGDESLLGVGEFQHSMPLGGHEELRCDECHTGGELPLCRDCHHDQSWLEKWGEGRYRPGRP